MPVPGRLAAGWHAKPWDTRFGKELLRSAGPAGLQATCFYNSISLLLPAFLQLCRVFFFCILLLILARPSP